MGPAETTKGVQLAFSVPPHLTDPSGSVAAWITDPPGGVVQFLRPVRGTAELARWLVGPAAEQVWRRFPDSRDLVFVFDLGLMDGRDAAARALLVESGKANKYRVARSFVIPPKNASAVYLNALHVSMAVLRIFGVRVDIESSMTSILAKTRLRAATDALTRPTR